MTHFDYAYLEISTFAGAVGFNASDEEHTLFWNGSVEGETLPSAVDNPCGLHKLSCYVLPFIHMYPIVCYTVYRNCNYTGKIKWKWSYHYMA